MNRTIAGILFFLCFVAPFAVTFTVLHYHKRRVRKEIKHQIIAGIDREELVLLKFTEEESQTKLRWKHSKEFEYNDQMYDIVEKETKGDTTYYWCWWDNDETKLNKQLDELLAHVFGQDPQKKENQKRLTNFYKSLYCEESPNWDLFAYPVAQTTTPYEFSHSTFSSPPLVPPPEFA